MAAVKPTTICRRTSPFTAGRGLNNMLTDTVIIAIISFAGTLIGTFGGIVTSGKLTNYRLEQLEKKVDVHNNFAVRIPILEEQIKTVSERLEKEDL